MPRRRCAAVVAVLALGACTAQPGSAPSVVHLRPLAAGTRSVAGHSVQGRELTVYRMGSATAKRRVLVIGVIHGDEVAGRRIALSLLHLDVPAGTSLWVVPDGNPDGVAAHTRQNAHRVDLNRNFSYDWAPIGRPGDQQYSGPRALSEPESAALSDLVRRLRPAVTVWFHQPVGVVDESGGSVSVEQRFANTLGEPLRRMTRYHGSATGWQNHGYPGTTAFVVELPRHPTDALDQRAVRAIQNLL
ncbi:MAG: murein peptide amidase [Frankiales bacterium]|nr:murein peptide amidase [Frankiales bacterium]